MIWSPNVRRGMAVEVHEDGSMVLWFRTPWARTIFGLNKRGKGIRRNTWWMFKKDFTPDNSNFQPGAEEATVVLKAMLMLLDSIEEDARQSASDMIEMATPTIRLRIAELELEIAKLKLEVGND